jgi:hypothetical protein
MNTANSANTPATSAAPPSPQGATLIGTDLLGLWEQGLHAPRVPRDDALLRAAGDATPPRALGPRNAALLAAHARWFGPALALHSTCPACAEVIEYSVDSAVMAQTLQASQPAIEPALLALSGHRLHLRAPDVDDLTRAEAAGDAAFANTVLAACVLSWEEGRDAAPADQTPAADSWPEDLRAAALAHIEALDPAASVSFDLHCPACDAAWVAPLDPGAVLWRKVQAAAVRLLQEIDLLARAYGWREPDILALSPLRRAAYLQLVQA